MTPLSDNPAHNARKISASEPPEPRLPSPDLPMPDLPRPTNAGMPVPNIYQPQSVQQQTIPSEPTEKTLVEYTDEESLAFYREARLKFMMGFAFCIPLAGVAIAVHCWLKTRKWNNIINEHIPNEATRMGLAAVRASSAWFIFACVAVFVSLTSFPFPQSLNMLSIFQIATVLAVAGVSLVVFCLCYFALDDDVTWQDAFVMGIRGATGCMAFSLVNDFILGELLLGFAPFIYLVITLLAIYAGLNIHACRPSNLRIFIIALVVWPMVGILFFGFEQLMKLL